MPPPTRAEPWGRRRAVRAPRFALPLAALALVAAGCGSSLGGRYDSATTAPAPVRQAGATSSVLRVVTAQPLPSLDPAFADTRQSRAVANALCTPLVRYADAEGLPGTVIIPGLAGDLPLVSRGSRTFRVQLLAGLHFADGKPITTADVRATFERLLDPATGSPGATLFREIVGTKTFRDGEDKHLRGVRASGGQITFTLKRSDPAFLARLAMPIACPVEATTPHREVPGRHRASVLRMRHLGCGGASPAGNLTGSGCDGAAGGRRARRAAARGARAARRPAAARAWAGATTAPRRRRAPCARRGDDGEHAARRHRAAAAGARPGVRQHAPVARRSSNLLCTPLVRYADAEGLPGHGDRPGPGARPADHRARQPHVPGAAARAASASPTASA